MKLNQFLSPLSVTCLIAAFLISSCEATDDAPETSSQAPMQIAHLSKGDTEGFKAIQSAFKERNPGYELQYYAQTQKVTPENRPRLAFMQTGGGTAVLGADSSKISVGDILYLPPDEGLTVDSLVDLLVFVIPEALPDDIPHFIRPDWDPNITDAPGGCATETNAYRRVLLTWEGKNGKYLYHALNAHRVRITNSFTHYHPKEGGFDEFYLVQMARPKARIITSEKVDRITEPTTVGKEEIPGMMQETSLEVGDLVYLPRGVAHRGIDSVLAQVITVPGFIPGSEIGLDHHLKAINDNLSLHGDEALPYHEEAAQTAIIK
jgi:hypothetical protein